MNIKDASKFRLQFITNETNHFSHIKGAEQALIGGCKWIQLRVKLESPNSSIKTLDELTETAYELKKICNEYKAVLIINDHVEVCKEIKAHGVHLGKKDMSIEAAQNILGDKYIIGGTANTFEDVCNLVDSGADYIGLGPIRFTETKTNISPLLGFSGIEDIMTQRTDEIKKIKIVAIGGITINDISHLFNSGVDGVAISGDILRAKHPAEKVKKMIQTIENYSELHSL